jgi:hypothetical protein
MPAPTNVRLLLRGLLVLSAREGEPNGKVGVLRTSPPGHGVTIVVNKIPLDGSESEQINLNPIHDALSLNVLSAQPNITIRNKNPVNRIQAPANQDSFNWFVDLERSSELYRFPIGANNNEFRPILTFNSGQLFTERVSRNFLLVQRGIFSSYQTFGYVAITIGVDFLAASSLVFKNGANTIFDSAAEPGTEYLIEITNDAAQHPQGPVSDANYYYRALGTGIPLEQRILFMSIPEGEEVGGPPIGPEAACFPAYLSETNIN